MKPGKKHLIACSIIFSALLIALLPVILSDNFLRQDDLTFDVWPGMKFKDLGFLYYNGVFQLVRPLTTLLTYFTFKFAMNFHNAVYIRLATVLIIISIAILVYFWQLLFNQDKLLAACYAIAAFTLPSYQIFAATANYFSIIFPLLITVCAMYCWYDAFFHESHPKMSSILGYVFFFCSLLGYPLVSMFGWVMLGICYLNSLSQSVNTRSKQLQFFYDTSKKIIFMMIFYFLFIKFIHIKYHVILSSGRSAVIDISNLSTRLFLFFQVIFLHAHLWLYDANNFTKATGEPYLYYILLLTLLLAALLKLHYFNGIRVWSDHLMSLVKSLGMLFLLLTLSFSPTFPIQNPLNLNTFRYTLATMPLFLYIVFWSIHYFLTPIDLKIKFSSSLKIGKNVLFIFLSSFGVCYSNLMLADGIVGPHQNDFNYLEEQLTSKVIPLLKQHKMIALHMIDCDGSSPHYGKNVPLTLEYGMRTCFMHIYAIEAVSHILMQFGYLSNFNKILLTQVNDKLFILYTPWGMMLLNNNGSKSFPFTTNLEMVTIDLNNAPPYNRFDFYKQFCNLTQRLTTGR